MIWSQTAVKDFERSSTCPARWKAQWVDRAFISPSNVDMDKGKYFEQLLLGSSASTEEKIYSLPLLETGSKSVDQIRIEQQAERGKRMLFDKSDPEWLGFQIITTQKEMRQDDRSGVADIIARADSDKSEWIIDVKLTKDLTNTRSEYGWGNDLSTMDLMQLVHYHSFMPPSTKLGLLIFDYSPKKRVKFVEVQLSQDKIDEKENRFLQAKEVKELYDKNGWIKLPSEKECDSCPLACGDRKLTSKLIKEIIKY